MLLYFMAPNLDLCYPDLILFFLKNRKKSLQQILFNQFFYVISVRFQTKFEFRTFPFQGDFFLLFFEIHLAKTDMSPSRF